MSKPETETWTKTNETCRSLKFLKGAENQNRVLKLWTQQLLICLVY